LGLVVQIAACQVVAPVNNGFIFTARAADVGVFVVAA
tara:strand:- start:20568 stop:20678 length:111 start_codon:yes stop_codon:yes gene_type:complete